MRGDLGLTLRLAVRPRGIIGLVGAVAGATALAAVYLPWYEVRATVTMLGDSRSRAIAVLSGWQAQPWIWIAAALALAAVAVGIAVAIDRAPRSPREVLLGIAVALVGVTGLSAVAAPPPRRFLADADLQRLDALADRMPSDVALEFSVEPSAGVWVALASAALLVAAAYGAREN